MRWDATELGVPAGAVPRRSYRAQRLPFGRRLCQPGDLRSFMAGAARGCRREAETAWVRVGATDIYYQDVGEVSGFLAEFGLMPAVRGGGISDAL
jgi:hypothetical protein